MYASLNGSTVVNAILATSEPQRRVHVHSRSEVGMARLVGGTGPVQDATAEVQSLADQVKSAVILPSPTNDNERFLDCPCVP